MKKVLPILIFLAFVAFGYQLVVKFLTTEHEITYSLITTDQKHYTVSEKYQKRDYHHYYSFAIKSEDKKSTYMVAVEEDFDKQDQVITDIKYYKKNNLECIFPIYKDGYRYDVSCLLDGGQVSSYYLTELENEDFSYIIKKFKEYGYDDVYYHNDKKAKEEGNLSIYYNYIPDDYIFAVWNYRGIDVLTNQGMESEKFLNSDYYENKLSTVVGHYYVTVNTDKEEEQLNYYQLILYDLEDGGKTVVDMDISQDSYFNGVSDNCLYITDPKTKKQYVLDSDKKELKESKKIYKIVNSKLEEAEDDFFDSLQIDPLIVSNKKITQLYDTTDIKKDGYNYYFRTEEGKLYRVIQEDYQHPILLGEFKDMKEWQVHDDGVSFIVGNTLYLYTDFYGLKPILSNPEFSYNSKNIYYFIRRE